MSRQRGPKRAVRARPAVLSDDDYFPVPLQRLQDVLARIHLGEYPSSSSKSVVERVVRSRGGQSGVDPGGEYHRRLMRRALARVERLARTLEADLAGHRDPKPRPGAVTCPGCGRGQRIAARYCDGCGASLADQRQ